MRLSASEDLQADASGLLVFTQDWRVLRKLTADAARIEQEYVVEVSGQMIEHGLNRLSHGLSYKGRELPAVKASWQSENRLRFALKNPQPGMIALLCQAVGLKVVAMRRIRVGGVSIGKVPLGQWRYLSTKEKF